MGRKEIEEKVNSFIESDLPTYCLYRQQIIEFLNEMDAGDERFLRQIVTMVKLHEQRKR